jgi:hypothetical protein
LAEEDSGDLYQLIKFQRIKLKNKDKIFFKTFFEDEENQG